MTPRDWLQILSFCLALYTFIGLLVWSLRVDMRRRWAFPALTWIAHTLIFYIFVFLTGKNLIRLPFELGDWSAFLRFHTYIITSYLVSLFLVLNGRLDGHHDNKRIS